MPDMVDIMVTLMATRIQVLMISEAIAQHPPLELMTTHGPIRSFAATWTTQLRHRRVRRQRHHRWFFLLHPMQRYLRSYSHQ